jgi:ketosteroid isomerase-like protein
MRNILVGLLLALLFMSSAYAPEVSAEFQMPKPDRTNAEQQTQTDLEEFYTEIEAALSAEDLDRIMDFYADEYLHHGITKKQLRFMWLEIFSDYTDLYSVHIFSKIEVYGDDAILTCTGALLGIPVEGGDYEAVDRWVNQNHWLSKVDGQWRMIGGATQQRATTPGSGILELHPLF